jgi:hypothetical protein
VPITARLPVAALLWLVIGCAAPAVTPSAQPTPEATCPAGIGRPPVATLDDADGNEIEGELGIYEYCGLGGDRPSAGPQEVVSLSTDEINVVISVPDGPPFVSWQMYSAVSIDASASAMLAQGSDPAGLESISFAGPPKGEWSIVAQLKYPGQTGQVMYYWRAAAP